MRALNSQPVTEIPVTLVQTSPRPDVIEIKGVSKVFRGSNGRTTTVFEDVNLSIRQSEFVLLLGPSGCGKSTLLNMIAGFEATSEGRILQDGEPVVHPDARRTMVFQDVQGSLFPWLSAQSNVEFGLRMAGKAAKERAAVAKKYLELVGLHDAASKMPFELSGGMKQRVQIARALATDPEVLLMDEPFGALDAQSRNVLQEEVERIWQETQKTIIFVTHDITEAVRLADRIVVFSSGPAATVAKIVEVPLQRPRLPTSVDVARLAQEIGMLFSIGKKARNAHAA
ncbi:MAG: ABC transporter ATP-binding protein [Casimicrobiaceae bacterium]